MDPMQKMWVSFIAIGLMIIAAVVVSIARAKTKGILRILLTVFAAVCLILGFFCGIVSIY